MYRGRCMECGGQKLLPPHLPNLGGLRGGGHQGAWLPGESGSTKGTCASGSVGVGVSVWSGPAPMASEVPGCR